jgi:hypothetical protein
MKLTDAQLAKLQAELAEDSRLPEAVKVAILERARTLHVRRCRATSPGAP